MTASVDLLWPRYDSYADLPLIEDVPLSERRLPETTYDLLTRSAGRYAELPAISHMPDAAHWTELRTLTYAELLGQVHAVAHVLYSEGVRRGDAVTLISPNCADLQIALLAAEAVGIAAPINPSLTVQHASSLLAASGSRTIVAAGPDLDRAAWQLARTLAEQSSAVTALLALTPTAVLGERETLEPIDGVTVGYLDELARDRPRDELPGPAPVGTDRAAYFHTGGTTGAPKLAVHTHSNEVVNAWMIAANTNLAVDANLFAALPLFHVNALIVTTLAPIFRGQHVYWAGPLGFRDVPLYGIFWKMIERYRINTLSAVPTVYSVLAQLPVDADISSLQFAVVGASALPPAVRSAFESHTGVPLCEGYGLTEATCGSARSFPGYLRDRAVGQRFPYQQMKLVDPDTGHDVEGADAVGELCISGPTVFAGYLRTDAEGGAVIDGNGKLVDGWLRTGDLARLDEDGFLYLVGRAKDLIIRGGHNIDPAVIEDAALAHPAVSGANAVGRPDLHAGEVPVLYVTVSENISSDELTEWLRGTVSEQAAVPKAVYLVDSLPVTDVGKPYKPALRCDAAKRIVVEVLEEAKLLDDPDAVTAEMVDGSVMVIVGASAERHTGIRAILDLYPLSWRFA
ncbi:acyl-CoA synthetase [Nocardia beijingensis]|uniref:acyl-CoA synthetase n=1 Tax=Nocardia beijingensis TaxID=95162 RepID=UPI00344FDC00